MGITGLLYVILTAIQWGGGYIDFGDGNYIYISCRMAQGVQLYRDILAPQPPCLPYLGMWVAKLAGALGATGPDVIIYFRAASMVIHLVSWMLVMRLAWSAWGNAISAVIAGSVYLILPLGYWGSFCWENEPLEMLFLRSME